MATNPATADDLRSRSLRPLTPAQLQWGTTALDDAWNIIVTRLPAIAVRLDSNPPAAFTALVVQVECAMVLRVLTNPDGKLQETIDDYTYRLDAARSTGALYLSDAEATLLGSSGGSETAFTIKPANSGPDPVFRPSQWEPFL
jgi:hypothetical protein